MKHILPKYIANQETIEKRKQKYIETLKIGYPNVSTLTSEEYDEIKKEFVYNRNATLEKLMEKSIGLIIESVAKVFATYDLDDVLSIEDTLEESIYKFNKKLNDFSVLPHYYSEYTSSLINYLCFVGISRLYKIEYSKKPKIDLYDNTELSWVADQVTNEQLDTKNIAILEFRQALSFAGKRLTEQEKMILSLRFGLETGEELTIQEVSNLLGLSRARISEAVLKSLKKLRMPNAAKKLKDFQNIDMGL